MFAFLRINIHSDKPMSIYMGFSNGLMTGKKDRHCGPRYPEWDQNSHLVADKQALLTSLGQVLGIQESPALPE